MTSPPPVLDGAEAALRLENMELRTRLDEANQALNAIRAGSVDAITVDNQTAPLIYPLQGAEHPYRMMVDTIGEGAITTTPDGVIVYCNERFAEIVESSPQAIVGTNILARFAGPDAADIAASIRKSQAGTQHLTTTLLASDLTPVPVLVAIRSNLGGTAPAIAIAITDLRSVAAALAATNGKLEAANKDLEGFAYSVSHDLRSPLRAIDGFSRILLEDYTDKLDAEGRRLLNVVRDSTLKMSRLIDDILSFSRAGRLEMTQAPVDMAALVRQVLANGLAPAVAGRTLPIEIGTLPPAHGDKAMLQRVWMNLLDNAIKYTAPKPDARIEIGATEGDGETVYCVRDTGVGFDMRYAGKLFGVFQRLHGAEFPGTGIGLAIVKRIVERHGGRVWAEGKPGDGATFYFTLPTQGAGSCPT